MLIFADHEIVHWSTESRDILKQRRSITANSICAGGGDSQRNASEGTDCPPSLVSSSQCLSRTLHHSASPLLSLLPPLSPHLSSLLPPVPKEKHLHPGFRHYVLTFAISWHNVGRLLSMRCHRSPVLLESIVELLSFAFSPFHQSKTPS